MKKILKLFLFILLSVIFNCIKNDSPLSPLEKIGSGDEYEIYSVILNNFHTLKIVLLDHTVHEDISEISDYLLDEIDSLSEGTIIDYQNMNSTSIKLLKIPNLTVQCFFISKEKENDWKDIHPDADVLIKLSRVGFNVQKDQALVYMSDYYGPLVAGGFLLYFEKENEWRRKKEIMIWIS